MAPEHLTESLLPPPESANGPKPAAVTATTSAHAPTSHQNQRPSLTISTGNLRAPAAISPARRGTRTLSAFDVEDTNPPAERLQLPDSYEIMVGNGGTHALLDGLAAGFIEQRSLHATFGDFSSKFAKGVAAAPFLDDPVLVETAQTTTTRQDQRPTRSIGQETACPPRLRVSTGRSGSQWLAYTLRTWNVETSHSSNGMSEGAASSTTGILAPTPTLPTSGLK